MSNWLNSSKVFLKRNSATILTCIGGAGVVATGVMAAKATPKAMLLLEEARDEKGEELTKTETVIVAGPAYIPAIITGMSTIACIFGANALNKRHQAALMSAYALLDNSYKEYRNKVKELYGEDADMKVREEIVKDHYEEVQTEPDKLLFYDFFSERYFQSTMEDVLRAEMYINQRMTEFGYAYLNDFYEKLGIPLVDYGDHLGWGQEDMWQTSWNSWLSFNHHKTVMDDGLECYIVSMSNEPVPNFDDY